MNFLDVDATLCTLEYQVKKDLATKHIRNKIERIIGENDRSLIFNTSKGLGMDLSGSSRPLEAIEDVRVILNLLEAMFKEYGVIDGVAI